MDFFVGITDKDWFDNLSEIKPDEVNFWSPRAIPLKKDLKEGAPFFFKLKSPHNCIAGGGYFLKWVKLPLWIAWESFGIKNGLLSRQEFEAKIHKLRNPNSAVEHDEIGCTMLMEPFFLEKEDWIPQPQNWSSSIVKGKNYSTESKDGALLWAQLRGKTPRVKEIEDNKYFVNARLGQSSFRALITDNYRGCCAISEEKTLPVLEAAHIKPYAISRSYDTDNGILLRSDLHTLLDEGYLTIDPNYRVKVSPQIRERWENGKDYYKFDNSELAVIPETEKDRPRRELLEWHYDTIFKR